MWDGSTPVHRHGGARQSSIQTALWRHRIPANLASLVLTAARGYSAFATLLPFRRFLGGVGVVEAGQRDITLLGVQGGLVGEGNVQLNFFGGAPELTARSAYLSRCGGSRRLTRRGWSAGTPNWRNWPASAWTRRPGIPWWRAGPWSGKSALLSTFVLRPPPEIAGQVRIVSFFITARLAAQDTREAFTLVLLEQLAGLAGEKVPVALPEATRDAWLLDLMAQAARLCQSESGRLVLVVDGLDEDRGVTTGPDAHSIAGLLPADPPAGMRVIVAGAKPAGPRRRTGPAPATRPGIVRLWPLPRMRGTCGG